nr:cbb3-type cytochrome oxidase assembly protein CcoS [Aestuariicella albida]
MGGRRERIASATICPIGNSVESLYLLVPIAIIFLVLAVRVLYWAVNNGQYDDLDTEGRRILFDDEPKASDKSSLSKSKSDAGESKSGATSEKD